MSILQMYRKGLLKDGCLVKCTKTTEVLNPLGIKIRAFLHGRPYRVIWVASHYMVIKGEGNFWATLNLPVPGQKQSGPSWANFKPVNG
jgi:hypothetical protein